MEKLIAYKRMPLWNKQTMPEAVQQKHNTKVGTWGKITVLKGALKFILSSTSQIFSNNSILSRFLILSLAALYNIYANMVEYLDLLSPDIIRSSLFIASEIFDVSSFSNLLRYDISIPLLLGL